MTKPTQTTDPAPTPDAPTASGLAKLVADRQAKLQKLRDEFGLDPYGHRVDGIVSLTEARNAYDEAADTTFRKGENAVREAKKAGTPEDQWPTPVDNRPTVRVAGRVMQHRVMGNLIFMALRDETGDMQVAVSKKAVGQPHFKIAKQVDLSDIVAVTGPVGMTNTGEVTVWAQPEAEPALAGGDPLGDSGLLFLTKSLAPPPGKHHGLTDPETRYRKRYVDLHTNPEVMRTMQKRIQIIDAMRDYLRSRGFLEVETPMLQSMHGGAAARPFETHHNALDLPLTLRIAPELYLKRLLVGGMTKVFEINRNFRNEGISPRHNPEFTMLEAYEAYGNWETMADLVEDMVCTVAEQIFGTLIIEHKAEGASAPGVPTGDSEDADNAKTPSRQDAKRTINLTRPWKRVSMADLVEARTGWKFDKRSLADCGDAADRVFDLMFRDKVIATNNLSENDTEVIDDLVLKHAEELVAMSPAEQLTEVYEKLIEPTLIDPCFVTRVPSVIIPLAKKCEDDPFFADVYELAINGVEISPGYSELNDPEVQEANFRHQVGDEAEQQQIDDDFLEALRVGMPPAGGMGLGIDRLVMMLTGAESIRDVLLFPLMKPQGDK
ncbi:MAG: lysine--tRNA ligase [Planctomycetota bacterium]